MCAYYILNICNIIYNQIIFEIHLKHLLQKSYGQAYTSIIIPCDDNTIIFLKSSCKITHGIKNVSMLPLFILLCVGNFFLCLCVN